ncbi:MAG: PmeII family type II restriction endonuclease [Chlorobiaceae bacterium]|jgi:Type II restriction endonuclease EcoO109I
MTPLILNDVSTYVEEHIGTFHRKRIATLDELSLSKVLKRKNPYLYKAKYVQTAEEIVRGLVDAHISSNEETIFGDWLEGLAIFINEKVYGGWKSGIAGIDLEFDKEGKRFIVNIKSGPNWGNSSQIAKMKSDFKTAAKTLRTSNSGIQVVAVNGCCYGKTTTSDQGDYFKYCGQTFWEFISSDSDLYTELIDPLGHKAQEKNEEFQDSYGRMVNKFTRQFSIEYCDDSGAINWHKLVAFNSSAIQMMKGQP